MPQFSYKARTSTGEQVTGMLEALTHAEALRTLQREGKVVVELHAGTPEIDDAALRLRHAAGRIRRDDVISLSAQLSVMLETGVPLSEALKCFVEQSRSGELKRVMDVVGGRITSGWNFSDAIAEFPKAFPNLMVSLLRASEASGKMGMMLGRVAEYLGKERKTLKQIKGALTYPAVMITLAMSVTSFLVVFVLPRFAKIYESKKAALPKLTKFVIALSEFITAHWAVLAGSLAALAIGIGSLWFFPRGRRFIDTMKVSVPLLGPVFTKFYLARATRTLGTLLGSGVTLLAAVRIVRGVTTNVLWQDLWDKIENNLTAGGTLKDAVADSRLIPPAVASMIAAGERTAKLPEVLTRVAQSTEEELDETIKTSTQLIEPAMIIFMGVVVGGIAIALLLPIFSVANLAKQH